MRCLWWLLLGIAAPAMAEKPVAPEEIPGTIRVSAEEVVTLIRSDPALVVIDTRRPEEHTKGHIEGAVSLPDNEINPRKLLQHLSTKETPVLFYCNGERCPRSARACKKAVDAGYRRIYWFRGGWVEWLSKGLPVSG